MTKFRPRLLCTSPFSVLSDVLDEALAARRFNVDYTWIRGHAVDVDSSTMFRLVFVYHFIFKNGALWGPMVQ